MYNQLHSFFENKKVLLLGFGLEGQSTMRLLEKLNCAKLITVWEKYQHTTDLPDEYDIIMKSPGIPMFGKEDERITGQADLFLRFCDNMVVGITGTKGKSTTSSLLHHILKECGVKSKLIGNIGVPPLDIVDELEDNVIVAELSCHQLEYVQASPKIAILLNIYEEHLDHYIDFAHYRYVKENIYRYQKQGDVFIRGDAEPELVCSSAASVVSVNELPSSKIRPEKAKLRGKHNIHNIAVAVKAATILGVDEYAAIEAGYSFGGLEHRLELFAETDSLSEGGERGSIKWVNDSISTIPAAAIAAVEAFPETDTLIIGGMDRGIDYSILIEFLNRRALGGTFDFLNIIALPDSGHKIIENIQKAYKAQDLEDAVAYAKAVTKRCCVFSPAAASYGFYKNFEERGKCFKELVMK